MSQFDFLASLKNEPYSTRRQVLQYTLHTVETIQKSKKALNGEDKTAILECAYGEVDALLSAIPNTASYKEKDLLFACEDLVLGLIMQICGGPDEIPENTFAKIRALIETVDNERCLERTLDGIFEQERINKPEVERLLGLTRGAADEYQKGMLYSGLVHYRNDISKLSDEAKALIADHISAEFERYLDIKHLSEDPINNLEIMSDICKHFANDRIISLVYEVLKLGYGNVNYYAAETLLSVGKDVPAEVIHSLAEDLGYADLTFAMLKKFGKQELFPKEYSTPEYLAKSDLVHWLMYPTELGKMPDEIEYIGKITYAFKKEVYHVFKYRSDSDNLGDDLKNKWLIGWSSDDGGTFSNFDEYALFEKGSVDATLKNIKKKILG